MNIKWMRRGAQRIAHAFAEHEVERFDTAVPLGLCDQFTMADLVDDPHAPKCVVCERAVRKIDLEQRRTALKTRVGGAAQTRIPAGLDASARQSMSRSGYSSIGDRAGATRSSSIAPVPPAGLLVDARCHPAKARCRPSSRGIPTGRLPQGDTRGR